MRARYTTGYTTGMDDEDRDYLAEEALAPVNWDEGGKVHNWRNYVGEHVRALWATLSDTQKVAIVRDADELASGEHWD